MNPVRRLPIIDFTLHKDCGFLAESDTKIPGEGRLYIFASADDIDSLIYNINKAVVEVHDELNLFKNTQAYRINDERGRTVRSGIPDAFMGRPDNLNGDYEIEFTPEALGYEEDEYLFD